MEAGKNLVVPRIAIVGVDTHINVAPGPADVLGSKVQGSGKLGIYRVKGLQGLGLRDYHRGCIG